MFEQQEERSGVLRLGDLVSETKPVVVARDGKDVALKGYVWGRRIPRVAEARVRQAYDDFQQYIRHEVKIGPDGEVLYGPDGQPLTESKFDMTDYSDMLTRVACALVEGLSPLEAEVLSFKEVRKLLVYLNYLKPQEQEPDHPLGGQTTIQETGASLPSESQPSTELVGASN